MKLLFDQNVSYRVVSQLAKIYPIVDHVKRPGLLNRTDIEIWQYAKSNEYTIVTFDSDFADIANINGHPPKIIWLRTGNLSTNNVIKVFTHRFDLINSFIKDNEYLEVASLEIS